MNKTEELMENSEKSEEISNKPLSDEELSSLIKASKTSTFNEAELRVKKTENENFKKVTLHDIAKQINQSKNNNNNYNVHKENKDETDLEIEEDVNQLEAKDQNSNQNTKNNNDVINSEVEEKSVEDNTPDKEINEILEEKKIDVKEHLKILEEEKNIEYEKGKKDALNEIKEGDEAAVAKFKQISETISKVDKLDLKNLEKNIEEKVIELATNLTGKIIKELPLDFLKKIQTFVAQLENIEGNIKIFINENDYKVIESNKNLKKEIEKLSIFSSKDLKHGEIELKVNGIIVRNTIK
jgi:hypothetical protein